MKKYFDNKIILLFIIILQFFVILYLIYNKFSNPSNAIINNVMYQKNDTIEIIKRIIDEEQKINRVKWNSKNKLEIIIYPFLHGDYSSDLINENIDFSHRINIVPQKGYLNILDFKMIKDSTIHIEYTIGNNLQGMIWLKKTDKWKTIRFEYKE